MVEWVFESSPGGVIGCCGANVDLKWVFRPVSSLGSGSINGSMSACCALSMMRVFPKNVCSR